MEPQSQGKVISATTVSFAEFDTVSEAFVFLTSQLHLLLAKAKFSNVQRSCIEQTNIPGGVPLSLELVARIKSCENVTNLFDVLADSPYWSWIDVRLLNVMAAASDLVEALQLLSNYKRVIFSKKLIDVIPNAPSKEIKKKYYTKIATKINRQPEEITVAELLMFQSELELVLLDIKCGICILAHLEKGCIEAHWYIPTSLVLHAYEKAKYKRYQFNDLHILYLILGDFPPIYARPDIVSSSTPVNFGKF